MARPTGSFDASRYFRGDHNLRFYNAGSAHVRALAREIYLAQLQQWTIRDAIAFADLLMSSRFLEVKAVGLELLGRYRGEFTPGVLRQCKQWLSRGDSANWATTDEMCGVVIGPLLIKYPELIPQMRAWVTHRNMWVRRASIVGLLHPVRRGDALDVLYSAAKVLHVDENDLIQKAVGWALREAGKVDSVRLERYLRANVARIPRTTFRYAVERFSPKRRAQLMTLR